MGSIIVNMGSIGSLVSSILCLLAGLWCIRKALRFINRTK
jgi:hypothetical protein